MEKLVDNGADVDDPDENGLTAIMLAASHQVDPGHGLPNGLFNLTLNF